MKWDEINCLLSKWLNPSDHNQTGIKMTAYLSTTKSKTYWAFGNSVTRDSVTRDSVTLVLLGFLAYLWFYLNRILLKNWENSQKMFKDNHGLRVPFDEGDVSRLLICNTECHHPKCHGAVG